MFLNIVFFEWFFDKYNFLYSKNSFRIEFLLVFICIYLFYILIRKVCCSGKESIGIDLRGNLKLCIIYYFEVFCIKLLVLEMVEMNNDGKVWFFNY